MNEHAVDIHSVTCVYCGQNFDGREAKRYIEDMGYICPNCPCCAHADAESECDPEVHHVEDEDAPVDQTVT